MSIQSLNSLYREDIQKTLDSGISLSALKDKSLMISGATGLIGKYMIDLIMYANERDGLNCKIYALGRSLEKVEERLSNNWKDVSPAIEFVQYDIKKELDAELGKVDFVIHGASTTHPLAYANEPIDTLMVNVLGLRNLLEYASVHENQRFVFLSSVEIYGENRGDVDSFDESYLGYIDCNTLRAGYPESKRAGEALCQAYIKEKGMDIVIPRVARTYGPTMLMSDSKALSQFIKKGIAKEDIVLKSDGTQLYSYTYVADAVIGILTCLTKGVCGEAYNIADKKSDVQLRDLAGAIAKAAGTKVVFEIPDATEAAGYSKATKATMDGSKIARDLGWKSLYNIEEGLAQTLSILKND